MLDLVGPSSHFFMHNQMMKVFQKEYEDDDDGTTRVYLSFLDASPTPRGAVIQAPSHARGRKPDQGARDGRAVWRSAVLYRPLHDSEPLNQLFIERANADAGDPDRSKIAVLLVGHGQAYEWENEWPTETEQEMGPRNGVLELLVANGHRRENIPSAQMAFKEPQPAAKVEKSVRNAVRRVQYFSAAISADAMHCQYDVPQIMAEANIPQDIEPANLGAWNDDPLVIQAIKHRIDETMNSNRAAGMIPER